jgi:murein DD-endopeptidase MepM/ murein hydrolase activator NlpD
LSEAPAATQKQGSTEGSPDGADPEDGVVHIVQPGQTLWRIARAYDIDLGKLAEANGIADPAHVDVGTPIFVPGAKATLEVAAYPAPPPSQRKHDAIRPEPAADFLWPVSGGEFMRPFGEPRRHHVHAGVDIRGTRGQDILAAKDGVVAYEGSTNTGYGTMIVLDHGDGVQTLYAHAQKILVKQGDAVRRGQAIALLGRTGNATTEHCHFEIRLENRAVDPMPYLMGTTEARR